MFLVVNERTGAVARRCRDILGAERLAMAMTEEHSWVFGDRFEVKVVS